MLNDHHSVTDLRHSLFQAALWNHAVLAISMNDILAIALDVDLDILDLLGRGRLNAILEGGSGGEGFGGNTRITIEGLGDPGLDFSCFGLGSETGDEGERGMLVTAMVVGIGIGIGIAIAIAIVIMK